MAEPYFTVEHLSTKELIRIFSKIQVSAQRFYKESPCWEWTASTSRSKSKHLRYGKITYKNRHISAHRLIFAWLVHPLPAGSKDGECDHLCRNTLCVNPIHIEFVSHKINMNRGTASAACVQLKLSRTHCKNGHLYTSDTVRYTPAGTRRCLLCCEATMRRYQSNPANKEKQNERSKRYKKALQAIYRSDPTRRERERERKKAASKRYRQNHPDLRRNRWATDPEYAERRRRQSRESYHRTKTRKTAGDSLDMSGEQSIPSTENKEPDSK